MLPDSEPASCRAFFGDARRTVGRLSNRGFSGSDVLLVALAAVPSAAGSDRWVLKSFGPGTSIRHAAWVHELMATLRVRGVGVVPAIHAILPDALQGGCRRVAATLVEDAAGLLWEAIEFMPGRGVPLPDASARREAMQCLALIHLAAATMPGCPPRWMPSRGLVERIDRGKALRERQWRARWQGDAGLECRRRCGEPVAELFERAIATFAIGGPAAVEKIAGRADVEAPCQPVLRDIRSDNVLFDGGRPSGIVDFHAAGVDTVAADLARLVGSWAIAGGGEPIWQDCLAAYEAVRRLGDEERGLVPFLHHAGVVVAIDNWFRWLVEERRTFPDAAAVTTRVGELVAALPESLTALTETPAASPSAATSFSS